ncbi:ATP-dependent helicase/nuclease subunit B [Weissella beninensis]|uniref:PD-(D/E)XK nuclease family protein n=1 Tax=Periweissella beninensis TaxID=504936 RepID=A0ABT0VF90_9LACO|nr:PD-(D/E)XK nuclease family protein [Periweissella beninensis]MBM7543532.1 ATP-dependent helicase/nuclease subunit B [Periweissella beninensis]MCM2436514.1 PD-(D/E)XK nuclease family protein [Periweissella beninensis]
MTLTFYTGVASSDHQAALLKNIKELATDIPETNFFYIVPNHIKFETEINVLAAYHDLTSTKQKIIAENKLQVFSLSRLVWYFMANTKIYKRQRLGTAGFYMLVKKVLREKKNELTIFQRLVQKPGFIEQLAQQISELRLSEITAINLNEILPSIKHKNELKAKLHDLLLLVDGLQSALADKLLTNTDILNAFKYWLKDAEISNYKFYFANFTSFTIQERQIIEELISKDIDITIGLTTDELPMIANDIFLRPKKLKKELTDFAKINGVKVITKSVTKERNIKQGLVFLEKYWIKNQRTTQKQQPTDSEKKVAQASITMYQAVNKQTELEQVARIIRQKVAASKGKLRYRDFLVLTRDLTQYQTMLQPIFNKYKVPIFTDLDYQMLHHPLVEFIKALFELNNGYRYQPLMRLLKTELLVPKTFEVTTFRDVLDNMENYILANNPQIQDWEGADWQLIKTSGQDDDWQIDEANFLLTQQVNELRKFIVMALKTFRNKLKLATTFTMAVNVLYQWLLDFGIDQVLINWRNELLDNGELVKAKYPEEVWQMLMMTLDECVELLGAEKFEKNDFLDNLLAGFSGAKFSGIPAAIDNVQVSETGIVQLDRYKIVIMLGGTRNNLPAQLQNHALLNDNDRQTIAEVFEDLELPYFLRDTSRQQMAIEPLLAYLSWLHANDELILTYPLSDSDDKLQKMSPYYAQIQKLFDLNVKRWRGYPSLYNQESLAINQYIGTPDTLLNHLAILQRESINEQVALPKIWQESWQFLLTQNVKAQQIKAALNYENKIVQLQPIYVEKLFGNQLNTSISQLETYNLNPYEYYLRYGLKLQERIVFELKPADTGQFFHAVLDQLLKKVIKEDINPSKLSNQAVHQLVEQVTNEILEEPVFKILKSSPRLAYITQQLVLTLNNTFQNVVNANRVDNTQPIATEVQFGRVNSMDGWQPLILPLDEKHVLNVRGKIDRIDTQIVNDELFAAVIDYKSGAKKFSYVDAYYGVALQLLTYLSVVRLNTKHFKKSPKIGGAFFAHIANPKIRLKDLPNRYVLGDVLAADQIGLIADYRSNLFKYSGILVDNKDYLLSLDDEVNERGQARFYNYKIKKNGDISKVGDVISYENLELLLKHNLSIIQKTGQQIMNGDFKLRPIRHSNQDTALQYSPYKAIMKFDAMLGDNYKDLPPLRPEEVVNKIMAEINENSDEGAK